MMSDEPVHFLGNPNDFDYNPEYVFWLQENLKTCREQLYYYPPTEPFAGDGVTWEQRAKELQEQLAARDAEVERLKEYEYMYKDLCDWITRQALRGLTMNSVPIEEVWLWVRTINLNWTD